MFNFKKLLASTCAVLMISSSVVFADSGSEGAYSTYDDVHRDTQTIVLNPDNTQVNLRPEIEIRPMWESFIYSVSSETIRKFENWSLIHNNADDVADSVTYSVSITKKASVSVGGSAEFNGLVAKATVSANTTVGVDSTESVSITWNLPKGKWRLSAGAMFNKVVGTQKYYLSGDLITSRTITADYTFDRYSDQVKVQ